MALAYRRTLQMFGVLTLVSGCTIFGSLEPEDSVEPARIVHFRDTLFIAVQDTVSSGVDFPVFLDTFGDYCIQRIERTEVAITGRVVEIRPFNRKRVYDPSACSSDLITLRHKPTLRVDTPGPLTIRVYGTQKISQTIGRDDIAMQLSRTITVR